MNSQRQFVSGLPGPDRIQKKTLQQALDDLGRAIQERKLRDRHIPPSDHSSNEVKEKEEEKKARLEELDAEEWYAEKARREKVQAAFAAAWARRDHLLSDDDQLPF